MTQHRSHVPAAFHSSGSPYSVRFAVAFSRSLESLLGALVDRINDLFGRGLKPAPQPVPVRSRRTYPRYLR